MFQTLDEAAAFIRHKSVAMVDLKFCDLWGRWRHVTLPAPPPRRPPPPRAEESPRRGGGGGGSLWGPEFEFYLFDGVSYENGMNVAAYRVEGREAAWTSHRVCSGYPAPRPGGH